VVVGRYCVAFRSCPRPDTRKGAPRVAAATEINRVDGPNATGRSRFNGIDS
jgi:hypothetical protein